MKFVSSLTLCLTLWLACLPILGNLREASKNDVVVVQAVLKTDEVETEGDAADDSVTYVNEDKIAQSRIIGTDKKSGLAVYDLAGKRLQNFTDGNLNNVDLRYEFPLSDNDDEVVLISSGNRTTNTIDFLLH
jgi:3-phytase